MSARFLAISRRPEDLKFGEYLAASNHLPFHHEMEAKPIEKLLTKHPQWLVYWDLDEVKNHRLVADYVTKYIPAPRLFAVSDRSLSDLGSDMNTELFNHFIRRRYSDPASTIYPKLITGSTEPKPFGLLRFFPEQKKAQKIILSRSGQKAAAVDAIQSFFVKNGVVTRLANLVARATDELIMNAVFDAPGSSNKAVYRDGIDRNADFPLDEMAQVQIEIASAPEYMGLCIADNFGTLKKDTALKHLLQNFKTKEYVPTVTKGAGLGLHGIVEAGLSFVFVSKPNQKTEVMLFFSKSKNYKDFREGLQFVSIFAG